MKWVTSVLMAAATAALLMTTACSTAPRTARESNPPEIRTRATHNDIVAGESVLVTAQTQNLLGARAIKWTVSPNAAKVTPQGETGQSMLFTADQPGTYVVTAQADAGNGRTVVSDTTITVHGRPNQPSGTAVERP